MDLAIKKRKHRLNYVVKLKDTSLQYDFIAAGVEEGVIDFFKLEGKEATKMKGRSKIMFAKKTKKVYQRHRRGREQCRLGLQSKLAEGRRWSPYKVC